MNAEGITTRALTYEATLVITPVLVWALTRAFPARARSSGEYETLRSRHARTETWSAVCGLAAMWGALAVMLVVRVGNTPWLVGVLSGWLVLAPLLVIGARTLPNGISCWREFWRFHELKFRISLRLLAPMYAALGLLGIVSTVVIVTRQ